MSRKYFGTDGIRGRANTHPMTAELALRLGVAVGHYFKGDARANRVVIGKDTRRSGYMLETALTAGLTSVGMDVYLLGPVPTPAVGMLTRSMRADLGVMISASHNPYYDNGIKFFGPDGYKLSDEVEHAIEDLLEGGAPLAGSDDIGRARRIEGDRTRYVEFAKTALPRRLRLDGLKIVIDCANGAAYKTAPEVLWELGAEVVAMGVSPNGFNINDGCGSTAPEAAAARVLAEGADLGICLDGDADRVIIIDETGAVADGDQLMGLIATRWAEAGLLARNTLVATVMSNLGLERHLADNGLTLLRTPVGDRYVVEEMRAGGYNLGGEQSGHIVMSDFVTTGDGLIGGLQVLRAMVETGQKASALTRVFTPVPQLLQNVRFDAARVPLDAPRVQKAITDAKAKFGTEGRLLIRKSGTEPLIRVMGEHADATLLETTVNAIAAEIAKA
ncbi:phosphoglucosamine mutase [Abyssibius alkaniclasticus]|uniref:phosphoglucosamine mutase n=1 Tax=Abyssibius alkaniclasticus TaxID=2881234 RepID=UPI0023633377|nr:phosphoglucosamine mutase [Abyssibius alkaniclasticus]UPH71106.1 phosphoglucosamine mutase [Abyssibius alkaniclasticus]